MHALLCLRALAITIPNLFGTVDASLSVCRLPAQLPAHGGAGLSRLLRDVARAQGGPRDGAPPVPVLHRSSTRALSLAQRAIAERGHGNGLTGRRRLAWTYDAGSSEQLNVLHRALKIQRDEESIDDAVLTRADCSQRVTHYWFYLLRSTPAIRSRWSDTTCASATRTRLA